MATVIPWTDAESDQLRQLHAEGKSLTQAAKLMGRGKATLSNKSKALGLDWDRSATALATTAKVADAKARRVQLELDYLDDAQKLRQQLWMQHEYIDHGGKEFVEVRWTQDQPAPADKLKLMQASTMAASHSLRLADHDAGTGAAAVVGLLQQTAAALGLTDDTDQS